MYTIRYGSFVAQWLGHCPLVQAVQVTIRTAGEEKFGV